MHRDSGAPAIQGGPQSHGGQDRQHRQAERTMEAHHPEIDATDHQTDRQPIANDDEGPRITGAGDVDQPAARTAFELGPSGEESAFAAVGAALTQAAPKRPADQFRA